MTAVRRYTEDEDAKIIAWRAEGEPMSEIAQRLGRNIDSVKRRADLIGAVAPSRALTAADVQRIIDLRRSGMSLKRIARQVRRATATVCLVLAGKRVEAAKCRARRRATDLGVTRAPDVSNLYGVRRYEDHPADAARPFRPVRVATQDPLGGLRKAS